MKWNRLIVYIYIFNILKWSSIDKEKKKQYLDRHDPNTHNRNDALTYIILWVYYSYIMKIKHKVFRLIAMLIIEMHANWITPVRLYQSQNRTVSKSDILVKCVLIDKLKQIYVGTNASPSLSLLVFFSWILQTRCGCFENCAKFRAHWLLSEEFISILCAIPFLKAFMILRCSQWSFFFCLVL